MYVVVLIFVILLAIIWATRSTGVSYHGGGALGKRVDNAQKFKWITIGDSEAFYDNHSKILSELLKSAKTCTDFADIPIALPYSSTKSVIKQGLLHNGQVKLFLTELRFLNEHWRPDLYVVYAGSAPSNKLRFLASLFPARFILIDPNEHLILYPGHKNHYDYAETLYICANPTPLQVSANIPARWYDNGVKTGPRSNAPRGYSGGIADIIKSPECSDVRFFIIEDYMTDDIATELAKTPCIFISDIRSKQESSESPTDFDILWNSCMMYNWLQLLRPQYYMLKFRTPYSFDSDIDSLYNSAPYAHRDFAKCDINFIENYKNKKFTYLAGSKIYLQAFAGPTSTESRIVGSDLSLTDWDIVDYGGKFFYYNRLHRIYGWHDLPVNRKIGLDHCGDCAIMYWTFSEYCKKHGGDPMILIEQLLYVCRRNLFDNSIHGRYYTQFSSVKQIVEAQKNHIRALFATYIDRKFIPMTLAAAVVFRRCLDAIKGKKEEKSLRRRYFEAWYFGIDSELVSTLTYPDIVQLSGDVLGLREMLQPPPVKLEVSSSTITVEEFVFKRMQGINPETQAISELTCSDMETIEVISSELEEAIMEFGPHSLIARFATCKVCGEYPQYNCLQDDLLNLPRGNYVMFAAAIPFMVREIIRREISKSGKLMIINYNFVEEAEQIPLDAKEVKYMQGEWRRYSGEILQREMIVKYY